MTFDFDVDQGMLGALVSIQMREPGYRARIRRLQLAVLAAVAVLVVICLMKGKAEPFDIILGVGCLVIGLVMPVIARRTIKEQQQKLDPSLRQGHRTYSFDDCGVHTRSAFGESSLEWASFSRWGVFIDRKKLRRFPYLRAKNGMVYLVEADSQGETDQLCRLFESKGLSREQ